MANVEAQAQAPAPTASNVIKFVENSGMIADIGRMGRMLSDGCIPDVNVRDADFDNGTALHYQSYFGTKEAMEWLLAREPPAQVDVKDESGFTPLMMAVSGLSKSTAMKDTVKIRLLLDHGADPLSACNTGSTPYLMR